MIHNVTRPRLHFSFGCIIVNQSGSAQKYIYVYIYRGLYMKSDSREMYEVFPDILNKSPRNLHIINAILIKCMHPWWAQETSLIL